MLPAHSVRNISCLACLPCFLAGDMIGEYEVLLLSSEVFSTVAITQCDVFALSRNVRLGVP